MFDATCAASLIKSPQLLRLLDGARCLSELIIDALCEANGLKKPRTYRRSARKTYLAIAKRRKKSKAMRRKAIRKQLGYVSRDGRHIYSLVDQGAQLTDKRSEERRVGIER